MPTITLANDERERLADLLRRHDPATDPALSELRSDFTDEELNFVGEYLRREFLDWLEGYWIQYASEEFFAGLSHLDDDGKRYLDIAERAPETLDEQGKPECSVFQAILQVHLEAAEAELLPDKFERDAGIMWLTTKGFPFEGPES